MIDKIRRLYPDYLIFVKRNERLFDLSNKELINDEMLRKYSHVIIDGTSYEVHTKINSSGRRKANKN